MHIVIAYLQPSNHYDFDSSRKNIFSLYKESMSTSKAILPEILSVVCPSGYKENIVICEAHMEKRCFKRRLGPSQDNIYVLPYTTILFHQFKNF